MTARNKTINTRGKPRIWNLFGERTRRDFLLQAAAGQLPGIAPFHVFGYDTDLANAVKLIYPEDIPYIYPSEAQIVNVVSDNAADTQNGAGARILRLVGLSFDGKVQTEDIWLRGTTTVKSIGDYRRVLSAFILSSGEITGTKGTITLTYNDGTFIGTIIPQFNVTVNGNFTVPANTNAYIYSYGFRMGAPKETFIGVRITSPDQYNPNWIMLDFKYIYGGDVTQDVSPPFLVTENTDIELVGATQADSSTGISAYMDMLLIDKDYDWDNLLRAEERSNLQQVE